MTEIGGTIKCTEFGDAMARYYVRFESMKGLLSLEPRSKMSDIVCSSGDLEKMQAN